MVHALCLLGRALGPLVLPTLKDALRDVLAEHESAEQIRPERVDVQTMAQLLDCSPAQIHRLCREEGLPYIRLGEVKRFSPAAVYAHLERRTAERLRAQHDDELVDGEPAADEPTTALRLARRGAR